MNQAYLLLGGNIGDRLQNLQTAKELLDAQGGRITRCSSVYETDAWGKLDQPSFLNQVVELETEMNPDQLMNTILNIESGMGRVRKEKNGPRIIDIDILAFNDEQFDTHIVKIPHPEMQSRRFALVPFAEIAAGFIHPVLKKSISQLLSECKDPLEVRMIYAP